MAMEFSGEYRVPAAPEKVWEALVDPEVLQACVPGCDLVEKTGEWSYKATCKLRMGPVSLNLSGSVNLEEPNPPHGCRMTGEGRDSAAGHVKGEAKVSIEEETTEVEGLEGVSAPSGTGNSIVRYSAKAVVGGRIAQLGGRLIDAAVKKYADEFFSSFAEYLGGRKTASGEADAPLTEEDKERGKQMAWWIWGGVAVLIALIFLIF